MQYFNSTDIQSWERFYRANLLSCLSGYKPAMLVGTVSTGGTFNVALFQNIVHLGANPALIGLINRPRQATPHTLANIEATGCFTLNTVHQGMQQAAHQTSAKYNELTSEFTVTGLTPQLRDGFVAPYVQQSVISLGLTVQQIVPITQNQTWLIIGEVKHIYVPQNAINTDGFINLPQYNLLCTLGLDAYAQPTLINRYKYAKPFEDTVEIQ